MGRIQDVLTRQRAFFQSGRTRDLEFRKASLRRFREAVSSFREEIFDALYQDLGKPRFESLWSEWGGTLEVSRDAIRSLDEWARPKQYETPSILRPGESTLYFEPYGSALVMGPWNFPFILMTYPAVGAMAAGNCVVIKTPPAAPHTGAVTRKLVESAFEPEYVAVFDGDVEESKALVEEKFDYIFFTGGVVVGKLIAAAAARNLTPVTLELGGKSPCIIARDADIELAARRTLWGKFQNAGQLCVATDYVLVQKDVKAPLLEAMKRQLRLFYGEDPRSSKDFGRIVSDAHFQRLKALLGSGNVFVGGQTDAKERYIAPTILVDVGLDEPVMQEEIFGPILPVIEFDTLDDAIRIVGRNPQPLALYLFTRDSAVESKVISQVQYGGGCVNDTFCHLGNHDMPFGGVGPSGLGNYHGEWSFRTFSHLKGVYKNQGVKDNPFYPPYAGKPEAEIIQFVS